MLSLISSFRFYQKNMLSFSLPTALCWRVPALETGAKILRSETSDQKPPSFNAMNNHAKTIEVNTIAVSLKGRMMVCKEVGRKKKQQRKETKLEGARYLFFCRPSKA